MKAIIYQRMKAQREVEIHLYPYTTSDPGRWGWGVVNATPSLYELSFFLSSCLSYSDLFCLFIVSVEDYCCI